MSIATAITAAQGRVADCYTAISGKGGTLPATQNLANMPTAINSIPSGGGGSSKYGCTIDNLLGDVDANGVLKNPTAPSGDIVFNGVKSIPNSYSLNYKFANIYLNRGVSFPDLVSITGTYACQRAFEFCYLNSVSLPELVTVSGSGCCSYMFYNNSEIESMTFPKLTTISGSQACFAMLFQWTKLKTVYFSSLSTITGYSSMGQFFAYCSLLEDVYFPALTTSSFSNEVSQFANLLMGTGTSVTHTLHFPSNLSSTISGLTGYPLFGGTSGYVTLAFDLPATT